jgi:adenylate cyclase
MSEARVHRRLAAILAADVVSFSRLMGQDEAGTLAALKARRQGVLQPLVARHGGRIFKITGDGVLVEFASAVNAVACAVELQRDMAVANGSLSEDRRIVLRVGVNLGDVMVEGGDLYGDGVNVAARLEGIAEPGGIVVSAGVFEHVRGKLDAVFEDLGARSLKNIAEPVRVYQVAVSPTASVSPPERPTEMPSIAVLPFTNMSGDPEQQYFSDGITEDIITELSRYRSLLVIARNSSFQFRSPQADIAAVRCKLGVSFVVEGSVRRIDTKVRLTAQLIDAVSESHVWAERYDCDVEEVVSAQDELTRAIVATLEGRIAAVGAAQSRRKSTRDWAAYDFMLQGREQFYRYDFVEAERLLERATTLDPRYAQAFALRANATLGRYWADPRPATLDLALECARKAISLDDTDASCHLAMGFVLAHRGELDQAEPYFERAVALNPNAVEVLTIRAWWLARVGRTDEALQDLDLILHRDPFPAKWFWELRGIALIQARRYEDAIRSLSRMSDFHFWDHVYFAVCHAYLQHTDQARAEAMEALRLNPNFRVSRYAVIERFKNPDDHRHLLEGMRLAGLPD